MVRQARRAQRRPALPGRQPRHQRARQRLSPPALNEGRPFRAGNPSHPCGHADFGLPSAQRRPALPGRQPQSHRAREAVRRHRSTKAGPSGPATRPLPALLRRPRVRRSTKAGPSGPATPQADRLVVGRSGDRSTKAGPSGPATLVVALDRNTRVFTAQRRPALPGRQPSPTSTIGALSHTSNIGECGKGAEKQQSRLRLASVLKDHSRFADRYRTHGSPNSRDRGRPSVVRDSWISPAKR